MPIEVGATHQARVPIAGMARGVEHTENEDRVDTAVGGVDRFAVPVGAAGALALAFARLGAIPQGKK